MKLSVTQKDIDYWVETFLPGKDIYYLDGGSEFSNLEGTEVLSVAELLAHPNYGSFAYANAYEYGKIDPAKVKKVLVAPPNWFAALPMQERAKLFRLQVQLGRGLVFGVDVLPGHAFKKMIEHAGVDGKLVLNHFLWNRLDLNLQQQTAERVARHWDNFECEIYPEEAPAWVKTRANSFIHIEGANSFGASLFGASGEADWLEKWVSPAEFRLGLKALVYQKVDRGHPLPADITVFYDEFELEQHACYQLTDNLVLNKSGQNKYHALKVTRYDQVLEEHPNLKLHHFALVKR